MKTLPFIALLFPFVLFSQQLDSLSLKNLSFSTNSKTGVSQNGVGITCKQVFIKVNGILHTTNTVYYNDKIEFTFDNIKGFVKKDGKVFPKMALKIINKNKDVVFSNPKLLDGLQGTDLDPLQLFAHFKADLDYNIDNEYTAIFKISDANGNGFYNYKYTFKVITNNFLNITMSDNVKVDKVFIWNKTKNEMVKEATLNLSDVYIIVFENISGLNEKESNVYPVFSIRIDNYKGHTILDVNHLLSQYEETGIEATFVQKNQITGEITFDKGSIDNPYVFDAKIMDKKTEKFIEVKAMIHIKE